MSENFSIMASPKWLTLSSLFPAKISMGGRRVYEFAISMTPHAMAMRLNLA